MYRQMKYSVTKILVILMVALFFQSGHAAEIVTQEKNINTIPPTSLPFTQVVSVGDLIYMVDGATLWKSDGTTAGTVVVKELGSDSSREIVHLENLNGRLFLTTRYELWTSDGTTGGTTFLKRFDHEPTLHMLNSVLYIKVDSGFGMASFWRSDGTVAGTTKVVDFPDSVTEIVVFGNFFYFLTGSSYATENELWRSDGTQAGTVSVQKFPSKAAGLTVVNNAIYCKAAQAGSSDTTQLWKTESNGTTTLVRDFGKPIHEMFSGGNRLYMGVEFDANNKQFWISDGTQAGTQTPVTFQKQADEEFQLKELTVVNLAAYFVLEVSKSSGGSITYRSSLYTYNANSLLLVDMKQAYIGELTDYGHLVYGVAGKNDTTLLTQVWQYSNNKASQIYAFGNGFHSLTSYRGKLFCAGNNGTSGVGLFQSSGAEFSLVKATVQDQGSFPRLLTPNGTTLFFYADGHLWKRDDGGTAQVKAFSTLNEYGTSPLGLMTAAEDQIFFGEASASDAYTYKKLWVSDGNDAGTSLVKDFGARIDSFTNISGTLFFSFAQPVGGVNRQTQLWRSNGSEAGTTLVKDFGSETIDTFTNVNGVLFLRSYDSSLQSNSKLWRSDGSEAGTTVVRDFSTEAISSLMVVNDTLFFSSGSQMYSQTKLWRCDGTQAGTTVVHDFGSESIDHFTHVNGTLFLRSYDSSTQVNKLWRSDGSAGGTAKVVDLTVSISRMMGVDEGLFISAMPTGTYYPNQLWYSNGTSEGTKQIKDFGEFGTLDSLTPFKGGCYFSASDGTWGKELWRSDGTAEGTTLVRDVNPGSPSSSPYELTPFGDKLFFAANDGWTGFELWAMSEAAYSAYVPHIAR